MVNVRKSACFAVLVEYHHRIVLKRGQPDQSSATSERTRSWIVPSAQLVIVRMGHMRGQGPARRATNAALGLVMEAIGASQEKG